MEEGNREGSSRRLGPSYIQNHILGDGAPCVLLNQVAVSSMLR